MKFNISPIKLIVSTFLLFFIPLAQGQISEVKEQIEDSYDYYEDALRKIKSASSTIDNCYYSNSVDDIQYHARDAESDLSSAKRYLGYAEDEAEDAAEEADDIDCSDAEDQAEDAEDYFYSAKRKIASAISELSSASYEDDPDQLSYYLSNAKNYISEARRKMNYAVDELNDALEELSDCD